MGETRKFQTGAYIPVRLLAQSSKYMYLPWTTRRSKYKARKDVTSPCPLGRENPITQARRVHVFSSSRRLPRMRQPTFHPPNTAYLLANHKVSRRITIPISHNNGNVPPTLPLAALHLRSRTRLQYALHRPNTLRRTTAKSLRRRRIRPHSTTTRSATSRARET